jgi:hypothetical protein
MCTYPESRTKCASGKEQRQYDIQSRPKTRSEGREDTTTSLTFIERKEPSPQGRDKRPQAREADTAISEDRTQFKDREELSRSGLKDVERARLWKVAVSDMVG